jgi:hypothetical protein
MFKVELEKTGNTYCAIVDKTDYVVERITAQEAIAFAWCQKIMNRNENEVIESLNRLREGEHESELELMFFYLDSVLYYADNDSFVLNERPCTLRDLMNNKI